MNHAPLSRTKRLFDLAIAGPALILLSPLFLLMTGIVAIGLGRPILFRQRRPGHHARPFTIYKFRTMKDAVDAQGRLLPDSERLTPLGRFLRKTSLDELPELFNVIRGEMSLVGPRPLLLEYVPYFTATEARRLDVLPGITGWAQINGRNHLSWSERLACDVWYVDHRSLVLDLKIIWRTLWNVLRGADVAADTDQVEPNLAELRGGGMRPKPGHDEQRSTHPGEELPGALESIWRSNHAC